MKKARTKGRGLVKRKPAEVEVLEADFADVMGIITWRRPRTMSPVMVAQYKKQLIPKGVLQRTFEEYLALPEAIPEDDGDVLGSVNARSSRGSSTCTRN